jgi:hypothetical protein
VKPVEGMADFAGGGSFANPAPSETNPQSTSRKKLITRMGNTSRFDGL